MIMLIITIFLIAIAIILHIISPITPWKAIAIKEMVVRSKPSCFTITVKLVNYAYYSQTLLIIFFVLSFLTLFILFKKKNIITNIFTLENSENNKPIITANISFFVGFNLLVLSIIFTELCAIYLIKISEAVDSIKTVHILISFIFIILSLALNVFSLISLSVLDVLLKKLKTHFTPSKLGWIFLLSLFIPFFYQYSLYNNVFNSDELLGLRKTSSNMIFEKFSDILFPIFTSSSIQISLFIELIIISALIIISLQSIKKKFIKVFGQYTTK